MKIITVASRKGGVGKTTTAGAVAQQLSRNQHTNHTVALIGLDSNCNAAAMLGVSPWANGITTWLEGHQPAFRDGLDEVKVLVGVAGAPGVEAGDLARAVHGLPFDFVVFDTPGDGSPLEVAAIKIADVVLAMSEPQAWGLGGAKTVAKMTTESQRLAFVLVKYDQRRAMDLTVAESLLDFERPVFKIPNEAIIPRQTSARQGFPRKGRAASEYFKITEWILGGEA